MEKDNASSLLGKVLLAMPNMGDPRFRQAVIYICAHDENGAMGLVINQKLPGVDFKNLLDQLKIPSEIAINPDAIALPVMRGGPVETGRGFLLHSNDFREDQTVRVDDRFSVTGTLDVLKAILRGEGPQDRLFILGYAGWSAGQLDEEIQQNAWLIAESDPAVIFHEKDDDKWNAAVSQLGFDPAMLSGDAGRA